MSPDENPFCKLPLLDGDPHSKCQINTVALNPNDFIALHELYKEDNIAADRYLCNAWAILLRCYTGQDERLEQSFASPQSRFQLAFREHEPLSACFARASVSQNFDEPDSASQSSERKSKHEQRRANTAVWIWNNARAESLDESALTQTQIDEVSGRQYAA
ncbi:MAG: hypothetical protein L6R40_005254 [Gallowayella cf. fulva]|nr:MAG: hypothetical protein L6R40_005254 [Xanthomendoza cf. fulva]